MAGKKPANTAGTFDVATPRMPSPLDPWADVQAATEQRLLLEVQTKADAEKHARELRSDRWDTIWEGVGIIVIVSIIAAVLLGIGMMLYRVNQSNRDKNIDLQRERTEQIQACTRLENAAERQLCIVSLNIPKEESR